MSKTEMEQLFAGLAGEGTTEASGLGFTLESAKAREKLQEFALAQPENYQLLAIAGLYALGCRHFSLTIDADDFVVRADRPLSREPFQDLWSFVSRGSGDSQVIGCRLLAMAILTSVRLDEMVWRVESSDGDGGWEHTLTVRRGLLTETTPVAKEGVGEGVVLSAKRKAFGQIARRFMTRWLGSQREGADEALIRQRLFLPRGASLVCNAKPLLDQPAASPAVLAVLQTGDAPTLVDCDTVHSLDRDYTMSLLLCHPTVASDPTLPGQSNHALWIWNGLRMDSTTLGAELDHIRAFVWAPELRPDLSFTSLVDNRDKQALERTVRSMARELLDRWVRALSAEMLAQAVPDPALFQERLSIVKTAIVFRIDSRKDWRRLASLNRALVECPLLVGSGPDGKRRWVSLAQILAELQAGRPVAAFGGSNEPRRVPPWPDRPLVLYSNSEEQRFLWARFPQFELGAGESVLAKIESLLAKASPTRGIPDGPAPLLVGKTAEGGVTLDWSLSRDAVMGGVSVSPGQLVVHKPDGTGFTDLSMGLPSGFTAIARADWAQSYQGGLLDSGLSARVKQALLSSFCLTLANDRASLTLDHYTLAGILLASLSEGASLSGECLKADWLLVTTLAGLRSRISPQALCQLLDRLEAPLYTASWSAQQPTRVPEAWADLPIALVPTVAEAGLSILLGRPTVSSSAFSLLGAQEASEWPADQLVWKGVLEDVEAGAISADLRSLTMGILRVRVGTHRKTRLSTFLQGLFLGESVVDEVYPFVRIAVDWDRGWPDGLAKECLGGPTVEQARDVMRRAGRALGLRFFAQATPEQIYSAYPDTVGTLMFELLSESSTESAPVLLLADGRKVSLHEAPAREGEIRYFTALPLKSKPDPDAVYLPGPMEEAIEMLSSATWIPAAENLPTDLPERQVKSPSPPVTAPSKGQPPAPLPQGPLTKARPDHSEIVGKKAPPVQPPSIASTPPTGQPAHSPQPPTITQQVATSSFSELATGEVDALLARETNGTSELNPLWAEYRATVTDQAGEPPSFHLFHLFLLRCQTDSTSPRALIWRQDGDPVLGQPSLRALAKRQGRLLLLSALFSIYNRSDSEVDDTAERSFHRMILRRALQPE